MATPETRTDKIHLEIVTPRGRAVSATVDEVTAPSVNGEFGLLPGHLPLLAALKTGLVTYRAGGETKQCAVGVGFAEAGPNKLLVLTDECIERSSVDPVVVRKELGETQAEIQKLEALLAADTNDRPTEKLAALIQKENWLAAQLELYGDAPPPTMRPHEEYGPPPMPEDEEPEADALRNAPRLNP